MKKTMSRALSVILAVLMLASAMPFAFAAEPIVLTEANIAVWPTCEGEIYFGQKVSDGIILSGGVVTSDGTESGTIIPGKFEFVDPNLQPTSASSAFRASVKFIPDDIQSYTGFEVADSRNVTFAVKKATPVLADEENDLPVAANVEAGAKLSTSTLSGGQVKNPYNADEPKALAGYWRWTKGTTIVNESGYYQARMVISGYETIYRDVWVQIAGDVPETSIETMPAVPVLTYDGKTTWSEIEFVGGKAVVKDTTTEVSGKFKVVGSWVDKVILAGSYEIDVKFIPNDETQALPYEFKIPVTVNAAPITFETEDGTGVPTITVDYGKKTNDDMALLLKQYVPEDVQIQYIDFYGLDGQLLEHANKIYDPGSYTLTCRGLTQNKNYATTMLTFNLVVNPITITPAIEGNGNRMIIRDVTGQYNPKGTFDLYINDELVKEDIPYNEYFTWEHTTSGDKNFKAVYKPGDDNRYEIDPITRNDTGIILEWNVVANNTEIAPKKYAYNSAVTLAAPAYDPATPDKPYYGFAGWEDVNGNTGLAEEQLKNAEITFTMPDADVELKATYKFSIKLFFEWILAQITQFFTFIVNAVKDLIALV